MSFHNKDFFYFYHCFCITNTILLWCFSLKLLSRLVCSLASMHPSGSSSAIASLVPSADDANYSNLRWLWVFFLLVFFCLLVLSHVFLPIVGYVHSQATVLGMPTWWLGWTCPMLPWELWTCLNNFCSYLSPGMIAVSLQDNHKLVCN